MMNQPNILEILNDHAEYKMSTMETVGELKREIDNVIGMLASRACDRQAATIMLGIYSYYYFQIIGKEGRRVSCGNLSG